MRFCEADGDWVGVCSADTSKSFRCPGMAPVVEREERARGGDCTAAAAAAEDGCTSSMEATSCSTEALAFVADKSGGRPWFAAVGLAAATGGALEAIARAAKRAERGREGAGFGSCRAA